MDIKKLSALFLFCASCSSTAGSTKNAVAAAPELTVQDQAAAFVADFSKKWQPLFKEMNLGWWEANTTGSDEAFAREEKAENELSTLCSSSEDFKKILSWRDSAAITDPLLRRSLDILYRFYLPNQIEADKLAKITTLSAKANQAFNTHRSLVGGRELTENQVREILRTSTDSTEVKEAWEGYHKVGEKTAPLLAELVVLRNESAKAAGFDNFYDMSLAAMEINKEDLFKLLDELAILTDEPFARVKEEIDTALAQKFGIEKSALMPWHHQDLFFQEVPEISAFNLDEAYKNHELVKLVPQYYKSIGFDVTPVLERSSLYEQPGKSPHAFMVDIDREGDVRVLTNIQNSAYWADTLLHELGHSFYQVNIDSQLPVLLREAAHECTTEGVAMMFGSLSKDRCFLKQVVGLDNEDLIKSAARSQALDMLIFSRWAQVMIRFERDLYEHPEADHNKLWWDLKKRYQLINTPEGRDLPDYAAKMHFIGAPVYYQNYLYGHLFAAQLLDYLRTGNQLAADDGCFYNNPAVGQQLIKNLYAPGQSIPWPELVKKVTGEPLSAKAFAKAIGQL